jgi:hypothetical protein
VSGTLVERRLIATDDTSFYRIVDGPDAAAAAVTRFYRVFHSMRIVGEKLVMRLQHPFTDDQVRALQHRFEDILKGPADQAPGPIPQENDEHPGRPRLILPFNRVSYGRLRLLIDFVNEQ